MAIDARSAMLAAVAEVIDVKADELPKYLGSIKGLRPLLTLMGSNPTLSRYILGAMDWGFGELIQGRDLKGPVKDFVKELSDTAFDALRRLAVSNPNPTDDEIKKAVNEGKEMAGKRAEELLDQMDREIGRYEKLLIRLDPDERKQFTDVITWSETDAPSLYEGWIVFRPMIRTTGMLLTLLECDVKDNPQKSMEARIGLLRQTYDKPKEKPGVVTDLKAEVAAFLEGKETNLGKTLKEAGADAASQLKNIGDKWGKEADGIRQRRGAAEDSVSHQAVKLSGGTILLYIVIFIAIVALLIMGLRPWSPSNHQPSRPASSGQGDSHG